MYEKHKEYKILKVFDIIEYEIQKLIHSTLYTPPILQTLLPNPCKALFDPNTSYRNTKHPLMKTYTSNEKNEVNENTN